MAIRIACDADIGSRGCGLFALIISLTFLVVPLAGLKVMKLPFLFLVIDIYDLICNTKVTLSNTKKQIFLLNFIYMNEISKRILQYMEYKNLKPMEFMLSIGYKSDGNYTRMKQGNPPSDDTIKALVRKYPVNQSWLETGEGEMERNDILSDNVDYFTVKGLYEDEKQELARLRGENARLVDEVVFLRELLLRDRKSS